MLKLIFYDGHISNVDELCNQLSIDICTDKCRTSIDKIIIEKGYNKWGEQLPYYIKGYFSFAVVDSDNNKIFGARDRFGVIPFYYTQTGSEFFCGKSINQLISGSGMERQINTEALQIYLSFSYVPGENTFYKNVFKLLPGQSISVINNNIQISKYHEFCYKDVSNMPEKDDEGIEEYSSVIRKNLETYLSKYDEYEKKAFFLSSGVDSNYLYALSNCNNAFSIGFDNDNEEFDESSAAVINALKYGKKCKKILLNKKAFFDSIDEAVKFMEQPIGTASSVAFMKGCKYAAKEYDLCFTGEGADELFAGYEIYKKFEQFKYITYLGKAHLFEESEKRKILQNYSPYLKDKDIVDDICPRPQSVGTLEYMLDVDRKMWLEADSLMNSYKMSKAYGLKIEMPFINEEMFELAYALPRKYKLMGDCNKYILRKSSECILPTEIAYNNKKGFVIPIRKWMREPEFIQEFDKVLSNKSVTEYLNAKVTRGIFDEFIGGNERLWRKIWALYSFARWFEINF